MVDVFSVLKHPGFDVLHGCAPVAHIGGTIDQHTVAGRAAQRIQHHDPAVRVFFAQLVGGDQRVLIRFCHAGPQTNVKQVTVLKLFFKKCLILKGVQLRRCR